MCRQIDHHLLEACALSIAFDDHPFSGIQLQSFEDDIKAYETAVTSKAPDYAAAESTVAAAFANDWHMKGLWGPVIKHIAHSPGGREAYYNNNPPWNTWIRDLDRITSTLPDLLVRILASPRAKHDEEQWKAIAEKVAFIDWTLDYAHHNDYLGIPKRQIHLGTQTNTKLRDSSLFRGRPVPVFEENTPWNPRFRTDARKAPQESFLSQVRSPHMSVAPFMLPPPLTPGLRHLERPGKRDPRRLDLQHRRPPPAPRRLELLRLGARQVERRGPVVPGADLPPPDPRRLRHPPDDARPLWPQDVGPDVLVRRLLRRGARRLCSGAHQVQRLDRLHWRRAAEPGDRRVHVRPGGGGEEGKGQDQVVLLLRNIGASFVEFACTRRFSTKPTSGRSSGLALQKTVRECSETRWRSPDSGNKVFT